MSFHKSMLGAFAGDLPTDIRGYVPDADDGPWDLVYEHSEITHNGDELTDYGRWWEDDRWPEMKADAVKATKEAEADLAKWREGND